MRSCVFLDRDGVINEKPAAGEYITSWSDFRPIPSMIRWIRVFNSLGMLVVIVTNQRGVARGSMTVEELEEIHRRMLVELELAGAHADDVFYCPHEEDVCECRKPRPGLVHEACKKWNIDLKRSVMIGDSDCDRALAKACGLSFVQVEHGQILDVTNFAADVRS